MAELDSIEWATSAEAQTAEPSAPQKSDGWPASATSESTVINWMWLEQGRHLLFAEHHADLFDSIVINP